MSARHTIRFGLAALVALAGCGIAAAASLNVAIDGIEGEMQQAARASLTLDEYSGRDVTAAQIRSLLAGSDALIRKALEPFGYYNAQVTRELKQEGDKFTARFHVTPGPPVVVQRSSVVVNGAASDSPLVERSLRRFKPAVGETLDHSVYENSKDVVSSTLANEGYLKAQETVHRVEVTRGANSAEIKLAWDSGPRFRFGDVRFTGSQFNPGFLDRFVPWKKGDYYSPDKLLELQQRLVDADYFAIVTALPNLAAAKGDTVPVDVTVTPAKRSVYTAGVYYSTDTGPGVKFGIARRWVNAEGHKLGFDVDYAQRLQSFATSYKIPLPGPNDKALNFGAAYRDIDTASTQSRTSRIVANETQLWHGFNRTLGVQFLSGTFEIGKINVEHGSSTLTFGEATLTRKVADDLFFPQHGYSVAYGLRVGPKGLLTDTSFSQVTFDWKGIMGFRDRQRLLFRASLGAMLVDNFDKIPPELRFFAGGDRSIRGFDYQQIGAVDAVGNVIGGTKLAIGSAEYERYFFRDWGAAVFVDGGDAFKGNDFNLNVGVGVGVRWRSPVGVVRVDVAKPVKSELAHSFRLHISLGPDL